MYIDSLYSRLMCFNKLASDFFLSSKVLNILEECFSIIIDKLVELLDKIPFAKV